MFVDTNSIIDCVRADLCIIYMIIWCVYVYFFYGWFSWSFLHKLPKFKSASAYLYIRSVQNFACVDTTTSLLPCWASQRKIWKGEFVYAVTAAEGIILSLFPMNNEDKMIPSLDARALPVDWVNKVFGQAWSMYH